MIDGDDEEFHGGEPKNPELTIVDTVGIKEADNGRGRGKSQFVKQIQYSVSLSYNRLMCSKWSLIHPHRIILGQLPSDQIFAEVKENFDIGAILSLVEAFEIRPVLPLILSQRAAGVEHLVLQEEDFGRIDPAVLATATEFMLNFLTKNPSKFIYVHCKAGRGRSSTTVVSYLARYTKNKDLYSAWKQVFIARPHISIDRPKVFDLHHFFLTRISPKNLLEPMEHKEWCERAAFAFLDLTWAFKAWWTQHHRVTDKQHRRDSGQNGKWGDFLRNMKENIGRGMEMYQTMLLDCKSKLAEAEDKYEVLMRDCVGLSWTLDRNKYLDEGDGNVSRDDGSPFPSY